MTFPTFCAVTGARARDEATVLVYLLQRRRIVRERRAKRWRLWLVVAQQGPGF